MSPRPVKLGGWGRYPVLDCRLLQPRGTGDVASMLAEAPLIARGAGRGYGDCALQPNATLSTAGLDHLLDFDAATGLLTCEAGAMLGDILDVFVPRGFFPPVTPGTRFVTVGGMIAADVHGKNHHRDGSFGRHLRWIDLLTADGEVRRCSPDDNPELFRATVGGMGLTGVILRAAFPLVRIETAYIRQETLRLANLEAAMAAFEDSAGWSYTVAWVDCLAGGAGLGRSLLFRGEHAAPDDLPTRKRARPFEIPRERALAVPCDMPGWLLNRWSARAFNGLYYRRAATGQSLVDYRTFFYPLDRIRAWNRIYGRRGLTQYQCVLPKAESAAGLARLLGTIADSGAGAFLAVLKLFGPGAGGLSFPMEGYTLALDFPATRANLGLLDRLDDIVLAHGGRLYLAKDARMSAATFSASYDGLDAFRRVRRRHGADGTFRSHQAERLRL